MMDLKKFNAITVEVFSNKKYIENTFESINKIQGVKKKCNNA